MVDGTTGEEGEVGTRGVFLTLYQNLDVPVRKYLVLEEQGNL